MQACVRDPSIPKIQTFCFLYSLWQWWFSLTEPDSLEWKSARLMVQSLWRSATCHPAIIMHHRNGNKARYTQNLKNYWHMHNICTTGPTSQDHTHTHTRTHARTHAPHTHTHTHTHTQVGSSKIFLQSAGTKLQWVSTYTSLSPCFIPWLVPNTYGFCMTSEVQYSLQFKIFIVLHWQWVINVVMSHTGAEAEKVRVSLVPRPHPHGEGLGTTGWFLGLH